MVRCAAERRHDFGRRRSRWHLIGCFRCWRRAEVFMRKHLGPTRRLETASLGFSVAVGVGRSKPGATASPWRAIAHAECPIARSVKIQRMLPVSLVTATVGNCRTSKFGDELERQSIRNSLVAGTRNTIGRERNSKACRVNGAAQERSNRSRRKYCFDASRTKPASSSEPLISATSARLCVIRSSTGLEPA